MIQMENTSLNINDKQKNFSFKKEERLCSKKLIERLFAEGESFLVFPLKFVFLNSTLPTKFPVQTGFSVGKKIFKKAVQRNLIKRKMREAFRLNKHDLYQIAGENQLALFIIFIGKTIPEYQQVEDAMKKGLNKLLKESLLDKSTKNN